MWPLHCSHIEAIFVISWLSCNQFRSKSLDHGPDHCILFDLTPKHSGIVSPDTYWYVYNTQVIRIEGEINGWADSKPAGLPSGEDYWQVGPIGKQWPSLGFEGQMIADRWKPQSPRKKKWEMRKGVWGVDERGTASWLLPGGWKSSMMSPRLSVHWDVKLGWCNVPSSYVDRGDPFISLVSPWEVNGHKY